MRRSLGHSCGETRRAGFCSSRVDECSGQCNSEYKSRPISEFASFESGATPPEKRCCTSSAPLWLDEVDCTGEFTLQGPAEADFDIWTSALRNFPWSAAGSSRSLELASRIAWASEKERWAGRNVRWAEWPNIVTSPLRHGSRRRVIGPSNAEIAGNPGTLQAPDALGMSAAIAQVRGCLRRGKLRGTLHSSHQCSLLPGLLKYLTQYDS